MFNLENTKKLKSTLLGVGLSTLLATSLFGSTKNEMSVDGAVKYPTKDGKIGLGQVYTTNISEIEKDKEEFIKLFDDIAYRNDYKFICLFITDIIKNGTYVIYSTNAKETLDLAFSCNVEECHFFPNIFFASRVS